jgi:hypothetical protein
MRALLGVLIVLAFAGSAYAATDAASKGVHYPGPTDDPTEVGYFPINGNDYCVGLGWDGSYLWIAAGVGTLPNCMFYLYDEYGNQIDSGAQGGGASGWGDRDLAFKDGVMFGSFSTHVDGHSYAGTGIFIYEGFFNGPLNPNRAMAWDGTYFYTGGFGFNVYRMEWNGVWGSTATSTIFTPAYSGTYGLAYDNCQDCLWMTTADYTGTIYKIDMTGAQVGVYYDLVHTIWGGCEMAHTTQYGYVLATVAQESPDAVVFYDVQSPSPVESASWGKIKSLF